MKLIRNTEGANIVELFLIVSDFQVTSLILNYAQQETYKQWLGYHTLWINRIQTNFSLKMF